MNTQKIITPVKETGLNLNTIMRSYKDPSMVGKNKPDKIAEHIVKQNIDHFIADVGNIRYKDYADKEERITLERITDAFCDNLIVYMLYPEEDVRKSKGNKAMFNQTLLGNYNKLIRDAFVENDVRPNMVNGKQTSKICNSKINGRITEEQLDRASKLMGTKYNKKITRETDYLITFKVALMDGNLETIMDKLPAILTNLKREGIYLGDIDITIDYAGTLDKVELIEYLTSNLDYRVQKDKESKGDRTILDNNDTVGRDCLSYYYATSKGMVRAKLYNKFVCQLTSAVPFKEHIVDFIDCPTKRLNEVFADERAIAKGITRTEITLYTSEIPSYASIIKQMDKAYHILDLPLFYSVPLKQQYKAITETITNTFVIVDHTHKKFYNVYYTNKLTKNIIGTNATINAPNNVKTRKMEGKELEDYLEKDFNDRIDKLQQCNAIARIPQQIVNLYYDEDGNVSYTQEARIKLEGYTYPAPGRVRDTELIPGAYMDNKVVFAIGSKRNAGYCEMDNYPGLVNVEVKTAAEITRINAALEEAMEHNAAKEELNHILLRTEAEMEDALTNYLRAVEDARIAEQIYATRLEQEERAARLLERGCEEVMELFKAPAASSIVMPDGILRLVVIRATQKEGCYIGIFKDTNNYYTCFLDAFCKKVLQDVLPGLNKTEYRGATYLHSGSALNLDFNIIQLTKTGIKRFGSRDYTQYSNKVIRGNTAEVIVLDKDLLVSLKQQKEEKREKVDKLWNPRATIFTEGPAPVKVVDCVKLEDYKDGEALTITKVYTVEYRKIRKYIMLVKNEKYVVSSSFLEDRLNNIDNLDNATLLVVKCIRTKINKNNKKAMDVEIRIKF